MLSEMRYLSEREGFANAKVYKSIKIRNYSWIKKV